MKSDFSKQQVGCVLVYCNRILSRAHNSEKTHTEQRRFNVFRKFNQDPGSIVDKCHAEVAAISKCRYADVDWNKVEVYVWRETKDSREHGFARPCRACMAALRSRNIRHVFYTTDLGYAYEELVYAGGEKT